jgi:DNA-directed RNA polymerase subunit N (RpoN/RPB10)
VRHERQALDYEDFRTLVREKAIDVAARQGWCTQGLNEVLDDLGLAPYSPKRLVRFVVHGSAYVDNLDGEDTEEVVQEWLSGSLSFDCTDGDFEDFNLRQVIVESVEADDR